MVKEYVRLFDGHIDVNSQPGEGSTFSVWLPVHRQAPVSEQAPDVSLPAAELATVENRPSEIIPNGGKPRLLIIEDNPDVIRYLHLFLQEGYQLITAFDGEQGIALALARVPDVIVCDIMMPKKGGLEVCRTLKTDFRTNHIPIVLMTAKNDPDSRIAGLESGADAYLNKPFN